MKMRQVQMHSNYCGVQKARGEMANERKRRDRESGLFRMKKYLHGRTKYHLFSIEMLLDSST